MPLGALDVLRLGVTPCESSVGGTGSTPALGALRWEWINIGSLGCHGAAAQHSLLLSPGGSLHSSYSDPLEELHHINNIHYLAENHILVRCNEPNCCEKK